MGYAGAGFRREPGPRFARLIGMRVLVTALLAAALAILVPQTCAACSCAILEFDESVAMAGAVFSGTVTQRHDSNPGSEDSSDDSIEYTIDVERVYRGEMAERAVVLSARDSASCGVDLVPGTTYLVLTEPGSSSRVGLCGGTSELRLVPADDLASLGEGSAPTAGTANPDDGGTPSPNTGSSRALGWGLGGLAAAAVVLLAAIWWPRRARSL